MDHGTRRNCKKPPPVAGFVNECYITFAVLIWHFLERANRDKGRQGPVRLWVAHAYHNVNTFNIHQQLRLTGT
jgi:hypothetical protein